MKGFKCTHSVPGNVIFVTFSKPGLNVPLNGRTFQPDFFYSLESSSVEVASIFQTGRLVLTVMDAYSILTM